jgi:hypothetical protein
LADSWRRIASRQPLGIARTTDAAHVVISSGEQVDDPRQVAPANCAAVLQWSGAVGRPSTLLKPGRQPACGTLRGQDWFICGGGHGQVAVARTSARSKLTLPRAPCRRTSGDRGARQAATAPPERRMRSRVTRKLCMLRRPEDPAVAEGDAPTGSRRATALRCYRRPNKGVGPEATPPSVPRPAALSASSPQSAGAPR